MDLVIHGGPRFDLELRVGMCFLMADVRASLKHCQLPSTFCVWLSIPGDRKSCEKSDMSLRRPSKSAV